jgi:hypothetical protein
MSSNAEQLNAKLAALAKAREEKEARRKREEEQERLEEELLQTELRRVEAEEKKRKEEERKRREAEEKQRKEEEAKAALAAAEAKKRAEMEQGKKRGRARSVKVVIGTRMQDEKGAVWYTQEGVVCANCEKSGDRCMWRDAASTRAKACRPCALMKKECPVLETRKAGTAKGNAESGPEAGSSKKRKLMPKEKGKGKEKERGVLESEVGADAGTALLGEVRGLRDNIRKATTVGRVIHRLLKSLNDNLGFIVYHVEKSFGPEVTGGGEEMEGVEGMEEGEGKEGVEGMEKGEGAEGSGRAGVEGNAGSEIEVEGTLVWSPKN